MKYRKSAYYFQLSRCSECSNNEMLFAHKYTDEILCGFCLDIRLLSEEEEEEIASGVILDDIN